MSVNDPTFSLAFTGQVKQVPGVDGPPAFQSQRSTDHIIRLWVPLDRARHDCPVDVDTLDESLFWDGGRGRVFAAFEAPIIEGHGRLEVLHDTWELDTGRWCDDFRPDHIPLYGVPLVAFSRRENIMVDPATIEGYAPMLDHPLEPLMGAENRHTYMGRAKTARLAAGIRGILGSEQEKEYLDTLDVHAPHRQRPRQQEEYEMFRFLCDGVQLADHLGGIMLFNQIGYAERQQARLEQP